MVYDSLGFLGFMRIGEKGVFRVKLIELILKRLGLLSLIRACKVAL